MYKYIIAIAQIIYIMDIPMNLIHSLYQRFDGGYVLKSESLIIY